MSIIESNATEIPVATIIFRENRCRNEVRCRLGFVCFIAEIQSVGDCEFLTIHTQMGSDSSVWPNHTLLV